MVRTTIDFISPQHLMEFLEVVGGKEYQVSGNGSSLSGFFTDAELELAVSGMQGSMKLG
jgi:hypothetical protein